MIPNLLSEVEACKRQYPEAWRHAHTGSARTEEFIRLLAARCHAISPRFGLNGKRGNPDDLSNDALCFKGEGPDHLVDGTPVLDVKPYIAYYDAPPKATIHRAPAAAASQL